MGADGINKETATNQGPSMGTRKGFHHGIYYSIFSNSNIVECIGVKEYEITGVEVEHHPSCICFKGFKLKGVLGAVDPFVGDDPGRESMGFDSYQEEVKWAKKQIGKTLICEELVFVATATLGRVKYE